MTAGTARRAPDTVADLEPRRVRLVLDVEFTLDEVVASLLWAELVKEATVDVVLLLPRLSSIAALVSVRRRRQLAQARQRRIEELAWIAGPRAAQLSLTVQRRRWRRARKPHDRTPPLHRSTSQEGPRK